MFQNINKVVLTVILLIYIYFVYIAYQDETSLTRYNSNKKKKFYTDLIFIASILFLIGGAISLYVASKSDIIDEELPLI